MLDYPQEHSDPRCHQALCPHREWLHRGPIARAHGRGLRHGPHHRRSTAPSQVGTANAVCRGPEQCAISRAAGLSSEPLWTTVSRDLGPNLYDTLAKNATTAGVDVEHRSGDIKLTSKAFASHIEGSPNAIRSLQENSVHYFQRPRHSTMPVSTLRAAVWTAGA